MNNWKVIPTIVLATVLIFGAGVVTGGILVNYVKQSRPHSSPRRTSSYANSGHATNGITAGNRPPKPPEILSSDFLQRLTADLQLDKEEHDGAQRVIKEGQNQIRKVLQDARLEMREVLKPEHREEFDALMKRPFRKPLFGTNAPPASATNISGNGR